MLDQARGAGWTLVGKRTNLVRTDYSIMSRRMARHLTYPYLPTDQSSQACDCPSFHTTSDYSLCVSRSLWRLVQPGNAIEEDATDQRPQPLGLSEIGMDCL